VVLSNWRTAATLATGATALAGWLSSPSPSAPAAQRVVRSAAPKPVAAATTIEEQATRLGNRLRSTVSFNPPQRNPFRYQPVAPPPRAVDAATAVVTAAEAARPAAAEPFPFRLSGTARDGAPETPVWTAILAGGASGLVLAKVGETVGSVYKIESVTDTTADLVDLRDGRTIQLTLPVAR
jgi:hypothetical protein